MSHVRYIDKTREYYGAQGYTTPYRWAHFDDIPFTPLARPLAECRVGLVTTSEMAIRDTPPPVPEPEPPALPPREGEFATDEASPEPAPPPPPPAGAPSNDCPPWPPSPFTSSTAVRPMRMSPATILSPPPPAPSPRCGRARRGPAAPRRGYPSSASP